MAWFDFALQSDLLLQTAQVAVDTTPSDDEDTLTIIDLLVKGGVIMVPIVGLLIGAIYIITDRLLNILRGTRGDEALLQKIMSFITQGDLKGAIAHARAAESPAGRVVEKGLHRIASGASIPEIESTIEGLANLEIKRMEKNMSYLGIIAGIAPMLGFIGTIIGVIEIFYGIAMEDNISIGVIAGGLYKKMITSCAGLIVGVVAYTGYHFLNSLLDKFIYRIERLMFEFVDMLNSPTK